MKFSDIYNNKKGKHIISYEVFPPKNDMDFNSLYRTIEDLKDINPDYVSVTYGAGGSNRNRTLEIASTIKNKIGIEVVAHLTCVNATVHDTDLMLECFKKENIENVLALRGDPPQGQENFTQTIGGFAYASELIAHISKNGNFGIAAAGYPEKHPEAASLEADVENLKRKIDNGATNVITQLFFNNDSFYRYRDLCGKKNINVKIEPGIMPILNFKSIQRMVHLCGAKIPAKLLGDLEKNQENISAIKKIGIDYAIEQIANLLDNQVDGIHFYAMNKSEDIKSIYNAVKSKIIR
ncbi:MAG: methylenetetrahydrofolate reductase [NAD(P)H] [Spirochaetales bacterium]|nr:methylenetetrahydrofolate reductase [NAD(P)H] [Spirochaetales bacterium]